MHLFFLHGGGKLSQTRPQEIEKEGAVQVSVDGNTFL
jgi:hypothetical protein